MDELGIEKAADLHRISGIGESTISRILFQDGYYPDHDVLKNLAATLNLNVREFVAFAYQLDDHEPTQTPPAASELQPRAAILNEYLKPDSHLTDDERATLDLIVDRVIAGYPKPRQRRRTA